MPTEPTIRRAEPADIEAAARLAGALVRMHHATDPERFLLPERVEQGYAWWLGKEAGREGAVVLVAVLEGQIVGYAYGALEERDWNLLLDAYGAIHDVFVAESARRSGLGRRLTLALCEELEARGAQNVVLSTMVQNEAAQKLFGTCGFRPTMLEMTRSPSSR